MCQPASQRGVGLVILGRACSHHVCTRVQSIARHFNFRTSDKASFQVRVTSEAVFLIRFLRKMLAERGQWYLDLVAV